MHIPDHFLDTQTTIATSAVATAVVVMAVQRSRGELAALSTTARDSPGAGTAVRSRVLLAAATTGLVFAVQMLNFPVAAGTSGHVMGGALAAALVGPALGTLSITAVVLVQALLFADGGLTALGPNVLLMAVVGTSVGWGTARAVHRAVQRRAGDGAAGWSAAAGALASVPASAALFAGLFAAGGTLTVPVGSLVSQMVGVHLLIGLGEAAITGVVVAALTAIAPRAVALASGPARAAIAPVAVVRRAAFVLGALAVVAAVAVSPFAASTPDGLEATARSLGFADVAGDHAYAGAPLAGYGAGAELFVGVGGLLGVVVCAALVACVLRTARPPVAAAP